MKNKFATPAKAAVSALLFYFLFRKVEPAHFGATLGEARLGLLVAAFSILWIAHYICVHRWRMLLDTLLPPFTIFDLFRIYCIGLFFNLAFPTAVGGDVVKMYYAGRPSRLYARSFAATFLDRDAGMFAMMILACAGTLLLPVSIPGLPVTAIVYVSSALFVLLNIVVFTPSTHRWFTSLLRCFRMDKAAARIDAVSDAFQVMIRHPWVLAGALAISLVNQLLVLSVSWVISLGLRMELPFACFLIFVPVVTLVSMIPITLNGMGLREYAFMTLLGGVGASPASAVALGILSSLMIILSGIPGGVVYIFFRHRSELRGMVELKTDFL